ncbi:hypothetical protein, partial [Veronia pacifica]
MPDIILSSPESIRVDGFDLTVKGQNGQPIHVKDGLLMLAKGSLTLFHNDEPIPLYRVLDLAGLNAHLLTEFVEQENLFDTENGNTLFDYIAALRQQRLESLVSLQEIEADIDLETNAVVRAQRLRELEEVASDIQGLDTEIHT